MILLENTDYVFVSEDTTEFVTQELNEDSPIYLTRKFNMNYNKANK